MTIRPAAIPDVRILDPHVHDDERGFFFESYNQRVLDQAGIHGPFVQDNQSRSGRHVLRGLHYQIRQPQGKLVRVIAGEVLDVAVDIRRSSPTFGRYVSCVLSSENKRIVWIPPGFAHGFVVRSAFAECLYKTTDYYAPEHERSILWSDRDLAIDWQIDFAPVLSPKDRVAPRLADAQLFA